VPGTTMPMTVPEGADRRALIDYLATLEADGTRRGPASASAEALPLPSPPALRLGRDAFGDFRGDGPGVRRRIRETDLPEPFATPSVRNGPDVVAPPPGARPYVPEGFRVDVFARDLVGPRLLRVAPCGDLFVAESQSGRIRVLRAAEGKAAAEESSVFVNGLDRPFGIAFYPRPEMGLRRREQPGHTLPLRRRRHAREGARRRRRPAARRLAGRALDPRRRLRARWLAHVRLGGLGLERRRRRRRRA
jgi:hypothetical protein